ncbi:MAG: hypothetical protein DPW09_42775 [Anaerolineae bacterium]|nr:hypothetical protein [Anaerolineales bacterium]MCQ3980187.1 hypothetical protein [Anaerolineae bacterium]
MSISSQSGIFGLAFQINGLKGGAAGPFYRYKTLAANIGPILNEQMSRPEMGGNNNPTGLYLSSAGFGGSVSLQPRLEGDFGWILLAATGGAATLVDTPGAGVNRHTFSQALAAAGGSKFLPFLQARRYIPGATPAAAVGELGIDCILSALSLSLAPGQPVQAELALQGREPRLTTTGTPASGWTWADVAENFDSVPMPMAGTASGLTIADLNGNNPLPLTNARVTLQNNTTSPDEEAVINSYFAEDFTPKMRTLSFEATYKWKDAELYRYAFNGGDLTSAVINPCLSYKNTVLTVQSPCDISDTIAYPWRLQVVAPRVRWRMAGPPQLAGDELIQMQLQGTAVEADSGDPEDYFQFILDNEQTAYAIPTA